MDVSPALLSDDGVFAAIAEVEASLRSLHVRRLRLLAEVLRRGLDADSYRRLVRADTREVKRWTAQVTLFLPSTSPPANHSHPCTP
ncbi:hypothetical protein ACFFSW_15185 [Saccharothrix longispora]|uniref:Sulfur transfer complex TusBCD TusB component (DsrH family) n=1 Tax=Saccharothrix longispora TaxID=33920 RepID=A0ABU1Q0S9_9PSEU|nr:hypothetical protein [Saccharothrix longispora]MDR6596004.1 sulfur transfer complex TusBCD TusB component (DsrH family) [Saccharothrix longispora]